MSDQAYPSLSLRVGLDSWKGENPGPEKKRASIWGISQHFSSGHISHHFPYFFWQTFFFFSKVEEILNRPELSLMRRTTDLNARSSYPGASLIVGETFNAIVRGGQKEK